MEFSLLYIDSNRLNMTTSDFYEWSVKKAFTREYYDGLAECVHCQIPRRNPHMCVYDQGEFHKMQPCPRQIIDSRYYKKYRHSFCTSCLIMCNPYSKFTKKCKESLKILIGFMLKKFDKNFTIFFIQNVYSHLIQSDVLLCIKCCLEIDDYQWTTYNKFISSYRKRRLQI